MAQPFSVITWNARNDITAVNSYYLNILPN